ncbi:MAG: response regulator transcription factor [Nitriliruptoraceae bacterium]
MVSARQRRILVVEDDSTLRESLEMFFGGAGYDVRILPDAQQFDETMTEFDPELVLLDVNLGEGRPNGFALARRLREHGSTPIIFLTAQDSLDDRLSGFEVGGDDYVTKPFSISELHARVRAVLRRADEQNNTTEERRQILSFGDIVLDEDARTVRRAEHAIELTQREFDLLAAFMENPQRVLSRDRLLTMVWGFEEYDANVVEVFVSTLRRKLEIFGPRVLQTVRGIGYVLRQP